MFQTTIAPRIGDVRGAKEHVVKAKMDAQSDRNAHGAILFHR